MNQENADILVQLKPLRQVKDIGERVMLLGVPQPAPPSIKVPLYVILGTSIASAIFIFALTHNYLNSFTGPLLFVFLLCSVILFANFAAVPGSPIIQSFGGIVVLTNTHLYYVLGTEVSVLAKRSDVTKMHASDQDIWLTLSDGTKMKLKTIKGVQLSEI